MPQPIPVEGPILPAKDKRMALLADVHTGGDSSMDPPQILYEGIGVPSVILAEMKDAQGPRVTIGFTYTQYEFRQPIGKRLTDEDWQKNFYAPTDDPFAAFQYTESKNWPAVNPWFRALFPGE